MCAARPPIGQTARESGLGQRATRHRKLRGRRGSQSGSSDHGGSVGQPGRAVQLQRKLGGGCPTPLEQPHKRHVRAHIPMGCVICRRARDERFSFVSPLLYSTVVKIMPFVQNKLVALPEAWRRLPESCCTVPCLHGTSSSCNKSFHLARSAARKYGKQSKNRTGVVTDLPGSACWQATGLCNALQNKWR